MARNWRTIFCHSRKQFYDYSDAVAKLQCLQLLTASMVIGWSLLSLTLARYSSLGILEGIIGCACKSRHTVTFLLTGSSNSGGSLHAHFWPTWFDPCTKSQSTVIYRGETRKSYLRFSSCARLLIFTHSTLDPIACAPICITLGNQYLPQCPCNESDNIVMRQWCVEIERTCVTGFLPRNCLSQQACL